MFLFIVCEHFAFYFLIKTYSHIAHSCITKLGILYLPFIRYIYNVYYTCMMVFPVHHFLCIYTNVQWKQFKTAQNMHILHLHRHQSNSAHINERVRERKEKKNQRKTYRIKFHLHHCCHSPMYIPFILILKIILILHYPTLCGGIYIFIPKPFQKHKIT